MYSVDSKTEKDEGLGVRLGGRRNENGEKTTATLQSMGGMMEIDSKTKKKPFSTSFKKKIKPMSKIYCSKLFKKVSQTHTHTHTIQVVEDSRLTTGVLKRKKGDVIILTCKIFLITTLTKPKFQNVLYINKSKAMYMSAWGIFCLLH